jgi:hypothetical protein
MRPSAARSRTTSPTNSGLPSVSRTIASTTDVGGSTSAVERTYEATSGSARPPRAMRTLDVLLGSIRVGIPVYREQRDACVGDSGGDELEHEQRRLVGDVEVVEDEQDGRLLRGVPQERRDGVEQAEARALRLQVLQLGDVREELAEVRNEVGEIR